MAGVVISDAVRKAGPCVFHPENLNQKLRELKEAALELLCFLQSRRIVREKLGIEDSHHGRAGARRGHDVIRVVKQVQNPRCYLARFISESGVERRLAAARLPGVESDLHAQAAQNRDGTLTHLRKELVCQASDEER